MDRADTRAEAIVLVDGRIAHVGSRREVVAAIDGESEVREVEGTILPGFVDPHHHACLVALWGGTTRLTPPAVTDIPSLQEALAESARRVEPGEWVVATEWDEMLVAERRPPTRQELDDAVPDNPLFAIHYSCHRGVANSRALELAGIDHGTPEPSGGMIERSVGGVPTGLLVERGMSRVESLARSGLIAHDAEGFYRRLSRHQKALLSAGITHIADATVPTDCITLYREANRRGLLIGGFTVMPVSITGYLEEPWDALDSPRAGEVEGRLHFGPIKLVFDGAPGCSLCLGWWQTFGTMINTWSMALRQRSLDPLRATFSVSPRFGADIRSGIAIYQAEDAAKVVAGILDRGHAVATHAIGNDAIEIALGAYEGETSRLHERAPARLEHAAFVDSELVRRIADVGAAVVTQPHLVTLPTYGSAASIPGLANLAHRWLLDAGVTLAASSDYPVHGFEPLDGIRSAVTRKTARGHAFEPDQCVTLDEALSAYTRVAAEVAGIAESAGTLEEGKRADLVILDRPLSEAKLGDAQVRATFVGGELVHGSPF
jgi:predicted amidohydrolase YtcJ